MSAVGRVYAGTTGRRHAAGKSPVVHAIQQAPIATTAPIAGLSYKSFCGVWVWRMDNGIEIVEFRPGRGRHCAKCSRRVRGTGDGEGGT